MQAIEIETDITPEGQIRLPEPLREIYGRHARIILLLDEPLPSEQQASAVDKLRAMRGALRDNPDFDVAMQEIQKAWQAWLP
jgi:bifunctional DNA-binding transcriptional regulator/antitoxin component of YhaV-PrlF toxin-antitoxin module